MNAPKAVNEQKKRTDMAAWKRMVILMKAIFGTVVGYDI